MKLLALAAACLLLTAVLAGCSDDKENGDGDGTSSSSTSASGTASGTSTTSGSASSTGTSSGSSTTTTSGGPANQQPTGTVSVLMNGTTASFSLTGSDADGDALVWDLEFGDGSAANGTVLPTNVTHAYGVGNYTATFTLSDGKTPHAYNVTVVSVEPVAGGGQPVATYTGTALPDPFALIPGGFCTSEQFVNILTFGQAGNSFPVDAAWGGLPYSIMPTTVMVTFQTDAFVTNPGTVPAGATVVNVCASSPTDAGADFTLVIG